MQLLRAALVSFVAALTVASTAVAWDEIQSAVTRDAGECVSWSPNRVDCFARTASGSLSWTYRENGAWSAPRDLGGKLASAPSCVVRGPGGINCFATSAKGVLATIYLNGSTWGKWASLGGELKPTRVSCVTLGRDRIACFARGRADQLMSRRWGGGKTWEPWRDLGGALGGDPECILVGSASAACFVRSTAGELVAFLPDATGRSGGWTTLGGLVEGKPSCVRLRSGEAACAAQSRSHRLQMWRGMPLFAANAGLNTSIDDTVTGEPACALQGATLVCFTRNSRRQLVRHSFAAADATHDAVLDAPQVTAITCLSVGEGMGCALTDGTHKLQFAADQGLEAGVGGTGGPATASVDESVEGPWYLAKLDNGGACRVQLAAESLFGAKLLRTGPRCRVLELPARPAQWDQTGEELLFFSADGRVLLRFHSAEPNRWVTSRTDMAFSLTREPPNETDAAAPDAGEPVSELSGAWRVFGDGEGELCTIRLTSARVDAGFAARWDPDCDDHFAGVRYWAETGGGLALVGQGNVVVARFDSAGPNAWRSPALGGLTLRR